MTADSTYCIGILGSGQLGRMIAIAAAQLGLDTHVYAPDAAASPAAAVAGRWTEAAYDDMAALDAFAASVNVVTSEFENVPAEVMTRLAMHCPASPGEAALRVAQHRVAEKTMASDLGIDTPRFWPVTSAADLETGLRELAGAGILKTCRLGYDGKGQHRVNGSEAADSLYADFGSDDAILEEHIDFAFEISCLVARSQTGDICHFPVSRNQHENGILARTTAPADIAPELAQAAQTATAALADRLDLFGLLAVEFFVTPDGGLLFNEMAPRPHNSFHWTIEGCASSQFTQLARVLAGLGFGDTRAYGSWQMDNLLGQHMPQVPELLTAAGVHLHLYGKPEARTDRKMGHATRRVRAD